MNNKKIKFILFAIGLLLATEGVASSSIPVSIKSEREGWYDIEAELFAPYSTEKCWEVLTDYEKIDEFVSFVKESRKVDKENGDIFIEQEAQGRFWFFSKNIHVLLKLTETPFEKIKFEDVAHKDFSYYHGQWNLSEVEGGTLMKYSLKTEVKFFAPPFIARSVMENNVHSYLKEIDEELKSRFPNLSAPVK